VEEWEVRERIADTIDALTRANGLLSRNYLDATANLTAVQARCTAQELELRVLRRAFALATGNAAPGYYLEQAREELAR
jgi:hypothetical protein